MTWIEPWRIAKSLLKWREQVDLMVPNRARGSDGGIGDEAHRARDSDHNPQIANGNGFGVVTAFDITHDPRHGVDTWKMADVLRVSGDKRIKYVISNGRIWNPSVSPKWRDYNGQNPHDKHVHVSVLGKKLLFDDASPWNFGELKPDPDVPPAEDKPLLRRGSRGPNVGYLQRLLKIPVDQEFGPLTEAAVQGFQRTHGLVVDGRVGPYTWAKLLATA